MTHSDKPGADTSAQPGPGAAEPARLWHDSRAELCAARAVLSEPSTSPRCAAVHLLGAWERLAELQAVSSESPAPARARLAEWVREASAAVLGEFDRVRAADTIEELTAIECEPPWRPCPEPSRARLEENASALAKALSVADSMLLAFAERSAERRRWMRRGAVVAAVLLGAIIYTAFWRDEPTGPWHAEYSTRHTGSKPIVRRDYDVDFDWKSGPPVVDVGIDRFRVSWFSCLAVESASNVTFELTSDDGSRLFVDGQTVIDNWGVHPATTEVATIELDSGVHALRVDYFDDQEEASIRLRAAFDDDPMGPIPTAMLIYPGAVFDHEDPCAGERDDADSGEDD